MNKKSLLLLIPFAAMALAGCTPSSNPQCQEAVVTLPSAPVEVQVGTSVQIDYSISIESCPISWSSKDQSIATVDNNGKVTGVKVGQTEIIANGVTVVVKVIADEPIPPHPTSSMKAAYEAGENFVYSQEQKVTPEEYSFEGVVVGIRTNGQKVDHFVQDGEYGIDVYSEAGLIPGFAIGKKVSVTAHMTNYNGVIETGAYKSDQTSSVSKADVIGNGSIPSAVDIVSESKLESIKQNIKVEISGSVASINKNTKNNDTTIKVAVGSDQVSVFIKGALAASKFQADIDALREGSSISVSDAVSGIYKSKDSTDYQVCLTDDSSISGEVPVGPSISLSQKSASIKVDESVTVTATLHNVEGTVTWSANNANVQLTPNGNSVSIKGVSEGSSEVTATIGEVSAKCTVNVSKDQPVPQGAFTKIGSLDEVTEGYYVIASGNKAFGNVDAANSLVDVTITNNSIDDSSDLKKVKFEAMSGGFAIKMVGGPNDGKYMSGKSGSNAINFTDEKVLNSVSMENGLFKIESNTSIFRCNLKTGTSDNRYRYYKPTTSDEAIVLVDLYKKDAKPVDPAVTNISVDPTAGSIEFGQTQQMRANVTTVGGASQEVTWSVSPEGAATISSSGLITAGNSAATITVTATSVFDTSKSASATFQIVAEAPAQLDSLTVSGSYKNVYKVGETFDKTGLVVTANYTKGKPSQNVTDSCTITPTGALGVGDKVKASYTEDGITKEVEIQVTISKDQEDFTGKMFEKVSSTSELTEGYYVVGYENKFFTGGTSSNDVVEGSVSGDQVEFVSGMMVVDVQTMTGGVSLCAANTDHVGEYLSGLATENNGIYYGDTPVAADVTISGGEATIVSNSKILKYNANISGGNVIKFMKSTSAGCELVNLYKMVEGGEITNVSVTPTKANLVVGGNLQLTATVTVKGDISKDVEWSSSMETVATVSNTGNVVATGVGDAVITVKAKENPDKSAICNIHVTLEPEPVVLDAINAYDYTTTTAIGSDYEFDGVVKASYSDGNVVTLAKSDYEIKQNIDTTTAGLKEGLIEYQGKECKFTVTVQKAVKTVSSKFEFTAKDSFTESGSTGANMTADGTVFGYDSGRGVQWSAAVSVVKLSNFPGTHDIKKIVVDASSNDSPGATFTCKVGENNFGESVSIGKENHKQVTFNGSASGCSVVITGTAGSKSTYIKSVEIFWEEDASPSVESVTVSPKVAQVVVEDSKQLTAEVKVVNGASKAVEWTSSNTEIATVDDTGLVHGVKVGEVTITATSKVDNEKFSSCAVSVVTEIETPKLTLLTATDYTDECVINSTYKFDGVVTATYSDGNDVVLKDDEYEIITPISTTTIGEKTGVIKYDDGETEKTCNFVVNVVAAKDVKISATMIKVAEDNDWKKSTSGAEVCYTSFSLDSVITVSTSGTPNCGSFWGEDWRLYQNQSGNVTISAISGYKIKTIKITYETKNTGALFDSNGSKYTTGEELTVNSSSVTLDVGNTSTAKNGQAKIILIEVVYIAE